MAPHIYTLGHSTRPIEEFRSILNAYQVRRVADVRSIPKSRHNPQYHQDVLVETLRAAGIDYAWLQALGGRRRTSPDSVNTAWRNQSFRGYADYMQTEAFAAALAALMAQAAEQATALLCAEAVPWRCHRSLIGDALLARGWTVTDILSETSSRPHRLTPWARVEGTRVWYPGENAAEDPPRTG